MFKKDSYINDDKESYIDNKNLEYLIANNRKISLYCNSCKIYYSIDAYDFIKVNHKPSMCDRCYFIFVDNIVNSYIEDIEYKSEIKKRNIVHRIKKLIYNIF